MGRCHALRLCWAIHMTFLANLIYKFCLLMRSIIAPIVISFKIWGILSEKIEIANAVDIALQSYLPRSCDDVSNPLLNGYRLCENHYPKNDLLPRLVSPAHSLAKRYLQFIGPGTAAAHDVTCETGEERRCVLVSIERAGHSSVTNQDGLSRLTCSSEKDRLLRGEPSVVVNSTRLFVTTTWSPAGLKAH